MLQNHLSHTISYLLYVFMIAGILAASISGATRAIEAKMDITGAILLAFITSNAGGTIRDLIIQAPVFWVHEQLYIWLSVISGLLTFIVIYLNRKALGNANIRKILIVTDAMGLAAFSIVGVQRSLTFGHSEALAIIMGVWTAIGGGMISDVIANRVPLVFSQELYITVSFLGSLGYLIISLITNNIFASIISCVFMIFLRLYSVKFKLNLPKIF